MMIIKISLVIVFLCFASIALNPRIKVKWFAKFIMCVGMINIIGVVASEKYGHQYEASLFVVFAFLFSYATLIIHKRGTYK